MVRIRLVRVGGMCRCRRFLVWSLRSRLAFGMRARRSISVTICAELAQLIRSIRSGPPPTRGGPLVVLRPGDAPAVGGLRSGSATTRPREPSDGLVRTSRAGSWTGPWVAACAGGVTKVHCQIHADDVISARTASPAVTMIG